MNILRRMIAGIVLVSFIMTASTLSSVAIEEATEEAQTVMNADDALLVEKLEALGVIEIAPESVDSMLTRREMAELVCRYLNLPEVDYDTTAFADVSEDELSNGAIMALYKMKIISGDGVNFRPDDNISYIEAVTMLVNAFGYKPMAVANGGYPTGYLNVAAKVELLDALGDMTNDTKLTLRDVLRLFEAGLSVNAVEFNSYENNGGASYVVSKEDFLSSVYKIDTFEGIVTGNEDTILSGRESNLTDEQIEIDFVKYDTPSKKYASLLGKSVTYYVRRSNDAVKEIAYIEINNRENNETTIDAEDLLPNKSTSTTIYYTDDNDKELKLRVSSAPYVVYNGRTHGGYGNIKNILPSVGFIKGLDNNRDGVCDVLFIYEYSNIIVDTIDEYSSVVTAKYTDAKRELDPDKNDVKIYVPAEDRYLKDVSELAVGDVLSVMESKGTDKLITVYVSRDVVSGYVDNIYTDFGICINDTYYKQAADYAGVTITLGMTADFYLDFSGRIADVRFGLNVDEDEKYAVLTGVSEEKEGFNTNVLLRMYTQDGEFLIVKASEKLRIGEKSYKLSDDAKRQEALGRLYSKGHGTTSIIDAYVVRFKMSDRAVSYLDIGDTGMDGKLMVLGEEDMGKELLPRKNASVLRLRKQDDSSFVYSQYSKTDTIVFAIPLDMSNENEYGILSELRERHYTNMASIDAQYKVPVESSALYGIKSDGAMFADVVLLRGSSASSPLDQNTSNLYIYKEMTLALDKDGIARKKISFGDNSALILADRITANIGGVEKTGLNGDSPEITGLKKGSIMQFGTNADGYIDRISVLAEPTQSGVLTYYTRAYSFGTQEKFLAIGTVESIDGKAGIACVNITNNSGVTYEVPIKVTENVQIYRKDYDKITTDSITSLVKNDYVAFIISDYYKATSIVAIK